jgi:hypothetical protein
MTMAVARVTDASRFDGVIVQGGRVMGFSATGASSTGLVNLGTYLAVPELLADSDWREMFRSNGISSHGLLRTGVGSLTSASPKTLIAHKSSFAATDVETARRAGSTPHRALDPAANTGTRRRLLARVKPGSSRPAFFG